MAGISHPRKGRRSTFAVTRTLTGWLVITWTPWQKQVIITLMTGLLERFVARYTIVVRSLFALVEGMNVNVMFGFYWFIWSVFFQDGIITQHTSLMIKKKERRIGCIRLNLFLISGHNQLQLVVSPRFKLHNHCTLENEQFKEMIESPELS